MERLICVSIGYLFGLFQTSYIYGRMHGIDIRDHGSGNAGTTNMLRTLGRKAGLITFAGDCLKCIVAVVVIRLLFKGSPILSLLTFYGAAGTILGHNYPCYLKFRGGKGIAATAGLVLSFNWIMTVIGILIFFTTFFLTKYVSLGSILVYIGIMVQLVVLGQLGYFHMAQAQLNELYVLGGLLMLLTLWKHRENIQRLWNHTENKTSL